MRRILDWALVQLVIGAAILLSVFMGLQVVMEAVGGALGLHRTLGWALLTFLAIGTGTFGAYLFHVRVIERRSATEVFAEHSARDAGIGALLGLALFSATIATLYGLGLVTFTQGGVEAAARSLGLAACSAMSEELLLRALLFRLIERCFGSAVALLVSAALFGIAHASNDGATPVSTAALAVEAGLLLAVAFMTTRTIWLAVGIHFGWNATEAALFGATVSGIKVSGLMKTAVSGPDWLSGGSFGVEASLVAVAWCVVAAALLLRLALRRGQWQPAKMNPAGRLVSA